MRTQLWWSHTHNRRCRRHRRRHAVVVVVNVVFSRGVETLQEV